PKLLSASREFEGTGEKEGKGGVEEEGKGEEEKVKRRGGEGEWGAAASSSAHRATGDDEKGKRYS
ncbi:hypothetical protein U1Q18_031456, partial [Sarracenia purpurea var. burkii]